MKITILIMTVFLMQVSALTKAQISIDAKRESLRSVLEKIGQQSGYDFIYSVSDFKDAKPVDLKLKNVSVDLALRAAFSNQPLIYEVSDKTVMVKKAEERSYLQTVIDRFQAIDVRGKVVDSLGNGLPGATVSVKGGKQSTSTNNNGEFYLKNVEESAVLVVAFLGYVTKEQSIGRDYNFIRMDESTSKLDEVQIQAYGTTTKRLSTGNISTVKSRDIERNVTNDPMLALKGRIPGLTIQQTTGIPGGNVKINIRGTNSFVNGTQPLVLVDGIPFDPSVTNQTNSGRGGGRSFSAFTLINPNDIESIDVLKDADATAIYGSRGANGVILISTKKGRSGAAKLDLKVQNGIGEVAVKRNLMNTKEYLLMRTEALRNDNVTPQIDASYLPGYAPDILLWDQNAYTDWQKEFLGRSSYTNFQGTISGGGNNYSFSISGNYNRETTVFPGDSKYNTGRIRFSLSNTSNNGKFHSILSGGFSTDKSFLPGQDFARYLDLPPNAPKPFNSDGVLNWALNPTTAETTWPDGHNPYSRLISEAVENKNNALIGNIELGYNLIPGLNLKAVGNVNQIRSDIFSQQLISGIEPRFRSNSTASANFNDTKNFSWQFEPIVSYDKEAWKGNLSIVVGATLLSRYYESQMFGVNGIRDDAYVRNPAAGTGYNGYGDHSEYKYSAYYGRLSYSFKNRYLFNGTIRTDGSSRFGSNKQFKNFGAFGAGWVFSEENLSKKSLSFLSFGKLRASLGVTGNDQIPDYSYLDIYSFAPDVNNVSPYYQGIRPLIVERLYNPNYGWERTVKLEYGLELGFFKDRILLTGSWYRNKSDNQLLTNQLPIMVGFDNVIGNLKANMDNVGQEYTITSQNITSKKLTWATNINFSRQKNRVINYDSSTGTFANDVYERLAKDNRSITSFPVVKSTGLDPTTGTFMFLDREGNPTDAFGNIEAYGTFVDQSPRFFGGVQNTIRYKNFEFDFFLQFVRQTGRNTLYDSDKGILSIPGTMRNQDRSLLGRWQQEGDLSNIRKFTQNSLDFSNVFDYDRYLNSSANYSDASFIRCNNLSLAWHLPKQHLDGLKLSSVRIFLQGQNLFTITNYKGWDPETQSVSSIPALRVFTFGFQTTL